VLDEKDAYARLGESAYKVGQGGGLAGRKPGNRLVEHDDLRFDGERPCDLEKSLPTVREAGRIEVRLVGESNLR